MNVLLVRHAKAEERSLLRRDSRRALTPVGRRDMAKAAEGLQRLVPSFDVLGTSSSVRARETAEILADRYGGLEITEVAALSPGSGSEALLAWHREQPPEAVVALIGHEPDLGIFASYLLIGHPEAFLPLEKAGACLIEFPADANAGAGRLAWLLPPRTLGNLA